MNAMDPCPVRKSGAHNIAVVLPGEDGRPFVMFCEKCGMYRHIDMDAPKQQAPLDDLPAAGIAYWTSDKGTAS